MSSLSGKCFGNRFGCVLALFGILVCPSWLRQPAVQASPGQTGGVSLRVDVELVTVEVIVLDKKGYPIRNLKKEDFQLFEDGKQQEIVTFAEVNDEEAREVPTSLADVEDGALNRGKVVLIVFDDSHITSSYTSLARQSAEKYVQEQMRPQDLFAVASYGMSLKLLQNFTHDSSKVLEAVRLPAVSFANPAAELRDSMSGMPDVRQPGRQSGGRSSMPAVQSSEVRMRVMALFRALNVLSSSVAPVKGRKAVILFSEDFSANSEIQTEFVSTINSAKKANVAFYTVDVRGLSGPSAAVPQKGTEPAGRAVRTAFSPARSLFGRLAAMSILPGTSARSVGGFSLAQQTGGGQTGGGQTGGSSGTGGGTGSGTGGGSTPGGTTPGGAGSTGGTTPGSTPGGNTNTSTSGTNSTSSGRGTERWNEPDFAQLSQMRMENMLRSLAGETGGVAIYNTGDFNGRLNEVTREMNNYYILGFQSSNPKRDGKFRRLKVKTEVKKAELRHREGYVDPRPLDVLSGSKGEKSLMSAIASPTPAVMLPVAFRAVYFYDSPAMARVPIVAKFRTDSIELKKKREQLTAALNVMGVAYSQDGSISARFSETLAVALLKDQEKAFREQGLDYRNYFRLRPGEYRLKIAVADEKGKIGSAEQPLMIPAPDAQRLAASSLVVVQQASRLPPLIQDLQVRLLEDNDPLIFRGLQVFPSVQNELPANKPFNVVFKLYNLNGDSQQRNLSAEASLRSERGETRNLGVVELDPHAFPVSQTEAMVGISLPLEEVVPGKYQLVLTTSEGATKRSVTLQTDIQFR